MKALVILFGLVALAGAIFHSTYFSWLDVDEYDDDAKLEVLYKCLVGDGTCKMAQNNLRVKLADVVATNCKSCNAKEINIAAYVINRIAQVSTSDLYRLLKVKDPTGKHSKDFLKFVQRISEEQGYPKLSDDVINGLPDSS